MHTNRDASEGDLTLYKSSATNNKRLAAIAAKLCIHRILSVGSPSVFQVSARVFVFICLFVLLVTTFVTTFVCLLACVRIFSWLCILSHAQNHHRNAQRTIHYRILNALTSASLMSMPTTWMHMVASKRYLQ